MSRIYSSRERYESANSYILVAEDTGQENGVTIVSAHSTRRSAERAAERLSTGQRCEVMTRRQYQELISELD